MSHAKRPRCACNVATRDVCRPCFEARYVRWTPDDDTIAEAPTWDAAPVSRSDDDAAAR